MQARLAAGYLPKGLANEIKSMLKQRGIITKRDDRIRQIEAYLFHPGNLPAALCRFDT
jgi:hypothetical protein